MSTFWPEESHTRGEPGSARKRARVLLVDDDPGIRRVLGRAIEREGLEVQCAASGGEALVAFDARAPQLVLLDVQMPGMSGFDTCQAIRERAAGRQVPIVIMTGQDDVVSIERAYEAGATDFLTKPIQWLVLAHRIRYLLRASQNLTALRLSQERLATAQQIARMGSWQLDIASGELFASDELTQLVGFDPARSYTVQALAERVHPDDRHALLDSVRACVERGGTVDFDHRLVRPDGSERVMQCQVRAILDEDGEPALLEGVAQDITERRRDEQQVRFLSYHDELTGLANRRLFEQRLLIALEEARREEAQVGVMVVDLDHFKRFNDTLGHAAGDHLLRGAADRLVECLRAARPQAEDASVARLGADEFTVLVPRAQGPDALGSLAHRIHEALSRPFRVEGHDATLGCSIGIALYPDDGADAETLLRNADAAVTHAKASGRANHQFYTESMNVAGLRHLILEAKLRRALEAGEFELLYQPKLELTTDRIVGFEGMVRWRDPELGTVLPGDFIPLAEETGLILPIGDWVFAEACRRAAAWRAAGVCDVPIAVNLSAEQFRRPDLASQVEAMLRETGADPRRIGIEVTESAILRDVAGAHRELEALRAMGIRIALDDFGTGYSSLSMLRHLPVDEVKIDRTFIREICQDRDAAALAASIVAMGKALGLRVVAEGVEDERERELLARWGCDELQGFLFSPPVSPRRAERLWRRHRLRAGDT